jgi:peptidoglycan/xylan/chitin deacetylase (PgdA/CDA1 family)
MSLTFGRLDRLATLYVAQPLLSIRAKSATRTLPILMYHSISEKNEEGMAAYYRTVTRPDIFHAQMQTLKSDGWRGVTLREGLQFVAGDEELVEKVAAITFDDGFEDFYTAAYPALREQGFSATMYLPTSYIGETQQTFKGHPCMTWKQVCELHAEGIEFGSHTVTHPKLWDLNGTQIARELRDSRRAIEDHIGARIPSFAYPYAFPQSDRNFAARFRQELQEAGYENCVTTIIGRVECDDDRFTLKRLPANSCDDADLLRAKLQGAYDWLAIAQNAVKSVKTAVHG